MTILTKILDFIKQYFLVTIIIILVILLVLNRCNKPKPDIVKPIITHDTVWIKKDSLVYSKPEIINTIKPGKTDTAFLPNPNYKVLLKQYNSLLVLYFEKNVSSDTLKLGKNGSVFVTDTVTTNKISNRIYDYHLIFPEVKETITLPPTLRNQLYIGGGIEGNTTSLVHQFNAGLMLKNKKDQLYGIYTGMNMQGQIQFGVQSYWKISFGK